MIAVLAALLIIAGPDNALPIKRHDQYDDTFRKYTKRFFGPGYDWQYFKAQGLAESRLRPDARSYVGARGIMQLMPGTYAELRKRENGLGAIDDPEWNIAAGIMYDRKLWEGWDSVQVNEERRRFMTASYNAGPGNVRRAVRTARASLLFPYIWANIERIAARVRKWRSRETITYVRRIDDYYEQLNISP